MRNQRWQMSTTVSDVKMAILEEALVDGIELTQTQLSNFFSRNISAEMLHRALDELLTEQRIDWTKRRFANRGRLALVWRRLP